MSNVKPGDLAIVVNEHESCLCNIGAILTVCEPDPHLPPGYWCFKDASRPLRHFSSDPLDVSVMWASSNHEFPGHWFGMEDRYLKRISPGETLEESAEAMLQLTHIPSEVTA